MLKKDTSLCSGWWCFCFGPMILALLASCQGTEAMPPTTPGPAWRGIVPGVSTEADVVRTLGNPRELYKDGDYTVYVYPSVGGGLSTPDYVVFLAGRARLVRVQALAEQSLALVLEQYGNPERVTWSPSIHTRTRMFIFARHGVAIVAQNQYPPSESLVLERWYFEPMALSQFGKDLAPLFVPSSAPTQDEKFPEGYWVQGP